MPVKKAVPFLDKNAYDKAGGYCCPNEDVVAWHGLVKDLKLERAAGICSGGEVAFFALLPFVEKELVLVDHSYLSLSFAMFKYVSFRDKGWKATKNLFSSTDRNVLLADLDQLKDKLPKKVANKYAPSELYVGGLARYWEQQTDDALREAKKGLNKMTFLHGDLTDLAEHGPFDLLYLSNALEHSSRTGRAALVEDVAKAVRPGGYVLDCSYKAAPQNWKLIKKVSTSWLQSLYQVEE